MCLEPYCSIFVQREKNKRELRRHSWMIIVYSHVVPLALGDRSKIDYSGGQSNVTHAVIVAVKTHEFLIWEKIWHFDEWKQKKRLKNLRLKLCNLDNSERKRQKKTKKFVACCLIEISRILLDILNFSDISEISDNLSLHHYMDILNAMKIIKSYFNFKLFAETSTAK